MANRSALKRFLVDEHGASTAEYALLLGVVVLALLAAARFYGTSVSSMVTRMGESVGSQS
jgi:pilus assembly protein Flp/PilA